MSIVPYNRFLGTMVPSIAEQKPGVEPLACGVGGGVANNIILLKFGGVKSRAVWFDPTYRLTVFSFEHCTIIGVCGEIHLTAENPSVVRDLEHIILSHMFDQ